MSQYTPPPQPFFVLLWQYLWFLIKYIYHITSGTSELERITDASQHKTHMTRRFAFSVLNSRKLALDLLDAETGYIKHSMASTRQVYQCILRVKTINTERLHIVQNIKLCIEDMVQVNNTIAEIRELRERRYDEANERHEELLEQLWRNLGDEKDSKPTPPSQRDWTKLGFQRRNEPRTDFRGMGELGLVNLVAFSETNTGKRTHLEALQKLDYSFAITGINLTADLYKYLTTTTDAKYRFMNRKIQGVQQFNEIYEEVFVRFHQYWKDRNATIMEFGQVKDDFWKEMDRINFWHVPGRETAA